MNSICTTECALCVETKTDDYDPSALSDIDNPFVIDKPHTAYKYCAFRHSMGEYEIELKSNGDIKDTVCYRTKIVLKGKRQRKQRPKNKCPRCGYKLN